MNADISASNAKAYMDLIHRKAPEYLDLLTSEDDKDFLDALDAILQKAVEKLETNSKNFQALEEEGLTGALAMAIEIPGLSVTQETNSNGHVDITIVADHCTPTRKILGEAKIYNGPAYHIDGLKQLLGRYITGRELRGLLIFYHRGQNIVESIKRLRERMDADLPCEQHGSTRSHILQWSFFSAHRHSSGVDIEVGHIGCNLQ